MADLDEHDESRSSNTVSKPIAFEMAAVLAIAYVPSVVHAVVSLVLYGAYHRPASAENFYRVLESAVFTTVPVLYILRQSGDGWPAFGICPPKWRRDIALGVAVFLVHIGWTRLWTYILFLGTGALSPERPYTRPTLLACALLPIAMIANAFSEELVMRGYLMRRLETILRSKAGGIVFSSLAWASAHLSQGPNAFVSLFMAGLVYGIAFAMTRRLWPVVFAHAAWNVYVYAKTWL